MFIRSFSTLEKALLGVSIGSLLAVIFLVSASSSPQERCLIAKAKIEVYEQGLMSSKQVYYNSYSTRKRLIEARVEEIKWCDHPLSRGN